MHFPPDDDRSAIARGFAWGTTIITISLEMVLPSLAGLWLDRVLGTRMIFIILGAVLGMTVGMVHLLRLASGSGPKAKSRSSRGGR